MKKDIFSLLKKELPGIQKNVPLKNHTTFKMGGPAEYFLMIEKKDDLVDAIKLAKTLKLAVFVFGGGSNLLVADEGIKGLVIKIYNESDIYVKGNKLIAHAGVPMSRVVEASITKSLKGLEWAGGLPGTFGGAIRGNAGAFGSEMKDSITSVEALDANLKLRKFNHQQCQFGYRTSIFKKKDWIVLSAMAELKKGVKEELRSIADSHINYRKEKHPLEYPNAGSIFKNVDVKKVPKKFLPLFLDKIKKDPFPIVPAAWFIIGAGLAGKRFGQVQISKKHSNYMVNLGNAKTKDIIKLIALTRQEVKKKYSIDLEAEVQYVGK